MFPQSSAASARPEFNQQTNLVLDDEPDVIESSEQFFAPVTHDIVDQIIGEYRASRQRIEHLASLFEGELGSVVQYFLDGNRRTDNTRYCELSARKIFSLDGAVAALNATYWSRTLSMTDVLDWMPQNRRSEWHSLIHEMKTPEFEAETVRATLRDLLASRSHFFAEKVDGIFRALSGEHVTNSPMGFGKRMIIARVVDEYGNTDHDRCGHITDLRAVIARFMGRDEPKWNVTSCVVARARARSGEWVTLDGGSIRLKVFKVGTAHLEIHPDMAWRLNCILAQLHPAAIPSEFRKKPKKVPKDFVMIGRPLPFAVIDILSGAKEATRCVTLGFHEGRKRIPNAVSLYSYGADKFALAEAEKVLKALGGVEQQGDWHFDYYPFPAIHEVVASGCVPDQKAHQFYPTPETVAAAVIEAAGIAEDHSCLEPSAGLAAIATLMPKDRTTCVEISRLHCEVLRAKGFNTIEADFLRWAESALKDGLRFDRICMNPPFSDGRAQAHIEAASTLVKPNGRLVAVLPASMRFKDVLGPGWTHSWSSIFENEFSGTSVSVAILTANKEI